MGPESFSSGLSKLWLKAVYNSDPKICGIWSKCGYFPNQRTWPWLGGTPSTPPAARPTSQISLAALQRMALSSPRYLGRTHLLSKSAGAGNKDNWNAACFPNRRRSCHRYFKQDPGAQCNHGRQVAEAMDRASEAKADLKLGMPDDIRR